MKQLHVHGSRPEMQMINIQRLKQLNSVKINKQATMTEPTQHD